MRAVLSPLWSRTSLEYETGSEKGSNMSITHFKMITKKGNKM